MALSTLAPGFRFHPTDDELVMFYLKRKLLGKTTGNAVAEINLYDFNPWDLPDKSSLRSRDLEWFFFCPSARKYSVGPRSNRATEIGFWKATGKDRKIKYKEKTVAVKKTLIFHLGHAGKGERTDWVMHEYKMEDEHFANAGIVQDIQDMYVLCRIFEKSGAGPRNGAQYGAPFNEEEWDDNGVGPDGFTNPLDHKQNGLLTSKMNSGPQRNLSLTEPGSSSVTFSENMTTNTVNCKQKDSATMVLSTITEAGQSMVNFSVNETKNAVTCKKGFDTMNITEPGSSTFTFSANERCVDVSANNDVMLFEDVASIMGMGASTDMNVDDKIEIQYEDEYIFEDLVNLVNLEELTHAAPDIVKNDGVEITFEGIFNADDFDADLGGFYVD